MQAIVYDRYGPPEVMRLQEVATPAPQNDEALIKIAATSVNRSDWECLIGQPLYARASGLKKPGRPILGSDIAGRVVQVGPRHTRFKPGDDVFGDVLNHMGGFAEYVCVRGETLVRKPAALSAAQAAALPQAGVIALQAIRAKAQLRPGQRVLINGAGGGVGMFAVQLAKQAGAHVTGVDNAGKLAFLRALGYDEVMDYRQTDYTRGKQKYDFILDLQAYRSGFAYARALKPGGRYYCVGGSVATLLRVLLQGPLIQRLTGKQVRVLMALPNTQDLETVAELGATGQLVPHIDRQFALNAVPAALRYLGEGRALGKLVIDLNAARA